MPLEFFELSLFLSSLEKNHESKSQSYVLFSFVFMCTQNTAFFLKKFGQNSIFGCSFTLNPLYYFTWCFRVLSLWHVCRSGNWSESSCACTDGVGF